MSVGVRMARQCCRCQTVLGWLAITSVCHKLRSSSVPPTSSTKASATSPTTSVSRTALLRRLPLEPRLASFRVAHSLPCDSCSAGAIPTTSPVTSVATSVKPNADASTDTARSIGMLTAVVADTHRVIQNARPTPSAPPAVARRRLSVNSCTTRRRRVAPRALRTLISLARCCARTRSRFERLPHATARTSAAATASTRNGARNDPAR